MTGTRRVAALGGSEVADGEAGSVCMLSGIVSRRNWAIKEEKVARVSDGGGGSRKAELMLSVDGV